MEYYQMVYAAQQYWSSYPSWEGFSPNYFTNNPAFQQLNQQPTEHQMASYEISSTANGDNRPTTPQRASPTQARDFKLKCKGCTRIYTSKKRLENHAARCLLIQGSKASIPAQFDCKKCTKSFKKRLGLVKHVALIHDGDEGQSDEEKKQLQQVSQRSQFHNVSWLAQSSCNSKQSQMK